MPEDPGHEGEARGQGLRGEISKGTLEGRTLKGMGKMARKSVVRNI